MARWTTVSAACKFLRLLTQFSPGIQTMKLQKYQPFRMLNNHKQDTTTVVSSSSKQVVSAPPVIGKWTYCERTKKFNPQIKPLPKCYKSKVCSCSWSGRVCFYVAKTRVLVVCTKIHLNFSSSYSSTGPVDHSLSSSLRIAKTAHPVLPWD